MFQLPVNGVEKSAVCVWDWTVIAVIPVNFTPAAAPPSQESSNLIVPLIDDCQHCCPCGSCGEEGDNSDDGNDGDDPGTATGSASDSDQSESSPDSLVSDHDDQPSGDDDATEELYAETVGVVGCAREVRYQKSLEEVQEKMNIDKVTVSVKLDFEPDNPMDTNAITVLVLLGTNWFPVGTIPRKKITKMTSAMRNNTITSVRFEKAPWYGFDEQGVGGLNCCIIVTKTGRWENDNRGYKYNDDLSGL